MGRREEMRNNSRKRVWPDGLALALVLITSYRTAAADTVPLEPTGIPDVPAVAPEPYAVMPFENRSEVLGIDWMSAAVPFVLAEKAEAHPAIRPAYGSLVLPNAAPVVASPENVAAFAKEQGAVWVWTGWLKRPNWDLQLAVSLWRVEDGKAKRVDTVVQRGDFKEVHAFTGKAMVELCAKASMPMSSEVAEAAAREPTPDFYAFTLFGRGLAWFAGTTGRVDLAAARKDLERAVFIDPKQAEAQRVLGELYRRAGELRKAKLKLGYAAELRPHYYAALAAQAALAQDRGKLERVRELDEKLLQLRPWDLERRFQIGKAAWEMGDTDVAFRELQRVVDHDPSDVRARRILVLIHASRGDGADLVRELEAVAELDPKDEATKLDLGAAYASVGRRDDAIATYEKLLDTHPDHVQALKFLGDLYKQAGDIKQAIAFYRRAMKAKPTDPRAYFLLGAIYVEQGNDRAAKRVYRRAQRFTKYLAEVHNNLGAIAYREGKYGESLWYLRRAVVRRPTNPRYRYNLALSLSSSKQEQKALEQLAVALKYDPDNADLHYLRGVVLVRLGKVDEARASFERALALDPDHEDAQHNLGLLEEIQRRAKEGEVVIEGRE